MKKALPGPCEPVSCRPRRLRAACIGARTLCRWLSVTLDVALHTRCLNLTIRAISRRAAFVGTRIVSVTVLGGCVMDAARRHRLNKIATVVCSRGKCSLGSLVCRRLRHHLGKSARGRGLGSGHPRLWAGSSRGGFGGRSRSRCRSGSLGAVWLARTSPGRGCCISLLGVVIDFVFCILSVEIIIDSISHMNLWYFILFACKYEINIKNCIANHRWMILVSRTCSHSPQNYRHAR